MFRRRSSTRNETDPAVNPNRTADLFALTEEGYIIAQDINCQYELVQQQRCSQCNHDLRAIAQINRAFQGLNELVVLCTHCGERYSFIFDISNDVYQDWWGERMGENYVRMYDGTPRVPAPTE